MPAWRPEFWAFAENGGTLAGKSQEKTKTDRVLRVNNSCEAVFMRPIHSEVFGGQVTHL